MLFFSYSFINDQTTIDNNWYLLSLYQNKRVLMHEQYKMQNNKFKNICIKNFMRYHFDHIIKSEDFDFDNILVDGKYSDLWHSK